MRYLLLGFSLMILSSSWGRADDSGSLPPKPSEILRKTDEIRNPGESYQMKVEVVSGSDLKDRSVFDVSIKGNDKTLIKTLEPARDRGRNLLMLGEQMWAYIPNLRRAVRVSLSQKLIGQAANGDISRMRWSGDYSPTLLPAEKDEWCLELAAKRKGLTYEKIRVWVEKANYHPLRAEFQTPSGKPLKRVEYTDFRPLLGRVRPHKMKIQDAVRADERSEIRILEMDIKNFPESLFNQNSLQ